MNKPRFSIKQRALMSDLEDRIVWLEELSGRLPEWARLILIREVNKDLAKLGDGPDDDTTALIRETYVVDAVSLPTVLGRIKDR